MGPERTIRSRSNGDSFDEAAYACRTVVEVAVEKDQFPVLISYL